jgi:hypothetical protein
MNSKIALLFAAVSTAASLSISAQTAIYSMDYDLDISSWSQGEKIADSSYTYLSGSNADGIGGTTAFSYKWDASGASGDLSAKVITKKDDRIADATTTDLSQLSLEFSVFAGGLLQPTDTFRVSIQLGAAKSNLIDFNVTKDEFTRVSLALSQFTFDQAPTIADINAGVILTFEQWGTADDKWGYDAGNSLILDNILLLETGAAQ